MANRKEDEKNEKIIRNLLKLPDNRRCINCNSLGPQYVCINFLTFICTNCSGIHREFTHRVKSISMAKFTSQEISALQGGGNAFPSMSSLQGALHTMTPPGGHGNPPSSVLLSHASSHSPMLPPGAYMGQQLPGIMSSSMHGQMQFGHQGGAYGTFNANPQLGGLQLTNATQYTLPSLGGNPFG